MIQFRNVSDDARHVIFGVPGAVLVEPDGVVSVADDAAESYDCQPTIWKRVDPVAPAAPLASKIAADEAALAADKAAAAAADAPAADKADAAPAS